MQLVPYGAPQRMSSREVAELTGKQQAHVMRDIRDMCAALAESKTGFCCEPAKYAGENGQLYDMYQMDKDTTICLLTGYDAVARMKVIQRWQQLEGGGLPQTYAQALRLLAENVEEKEALQLQLAQQQPAVETMRALTDSGEAIDIGELAKTLAIQGLGRNNLYDLLREHEVIQPAPSTEPYQRYVNQGYFKRVQMPYEVHGQRRLGGKTQVTPEGVAFVRRLIDRHNTQNAA